MSAKIGDSASSCYLLLSVAILLLTCFSLSRAQGMLYVLVKTSVYVVRKSRLARPFLFVPGLVKHSGCDTSSKYAVFKLNYNDIQTCVN